jgi:hypothetical protein
MLLPNILLSTVVKHAKSFDVDSAVWALCCVDIGIVAKILEVHAVKVCMLGGFHSTLKTTSVERKGQSESCCLTAPGGGTHPGEMKTPTILHGQD